MTPTPLSSITDAEAIEVARIMNVEHRDFWTDQFARFRVYIGEKQDKDLDYNASLALCGKCYVEYFFRTTKWANNSVWYCEQSLIVYVSDYLRSKGFAITYMGHSVAELEKAGWIKLVALSHHLTQVSIEKLGTPLSG